MTSRNAVLAECSRLRRRKVRGLNGTGPTVPAVAAAPTGIDPVLYLSFTAWKVRAKSTTLDRRADGEINKDRVTALLTDASLRCVQWVPGNLARGGVQLPTADLPPVLLGACRDVCRDLVDHWLSPRSESWREECAGCEGRAADRLRAVAQVA